MLRIENLTKTYGEKRAVDNLSLHIAPGEIYGFIGHNGAGKTTTLKAVVGILQFDKGEVFIKGESNRKNRGEPPTGALLAAPGTAYHTIQQIARKKAGRIMRQCRDTPRFRILSKIVF